MDARGFETMPRSWGLPWNSFTRSSATLSSSIKKAPVNCGFMPSALRTSNLETGGTPSNPGGSGSKGFGAFCVFLPFFFGFVAAKPPLARPVAGRSRSAVKSHLVIIALMRRWRELAPDAIDATMRAAMRTRVMFTSSRTITNAKRESGGS